MRFMFEEKANPQAIHTLGDFFCASFIRAVRLFEKNERWTFDVRR